MQTDIKYTFNTVVRLDNHTLDAFKIVMNDNCIIVFITTDSIQCELGLLIASQGKIRNISVCDIQSLVDALDESQDDVHQTLFNYLSEGLDIERDDVMSYDEFLLQVNWQTIPIRTQHQIFKLLAVAMDERVFICKKSAELIIKKYGRRQTVTNKIKSGFGK